MTEFFKDSYDEDVEIIFTEVPECEHCGVLEPYDIMIMNHTGWCENCYTCTEEIPEDLLKKARIESAKKKMNYFSKRLEELNNELLKLVGE